MKGLPQNKKHSTNRMDIPSLNRSFPKLNARSSSRHMMALHSGQKTLEGFAPREPDDWGRTNNQHWYDPKALAL